MQKGKSFLIVTMEEEKRVKKKLKKIKKKRKT